jgi:signal peptidase II
VVSAGADAVTTAHGGGASGAAVERTGRTWAWVWGSLVVLVGLDQLAKAWAVHALADGPKYVIGSSIGFELTRNSGSAFSRFQGYTPVLAVGALAVAAFLVHTLRQTHDRATIVGLVLVLAGALGNLADRIFRAPGVMRGEVVDFVKLGPWPVFNVADSCLTIGAILLAVRALRTPPADAD